MSTTSQIFNTKSILQKIDYSNQQLLFHAKEEQWDKAADFAVSRQESLENLFEQLTDKERAGFYSIPELAQLPKNISTIDEKIIHLATISRKSSSTQMLKLKLGKKASNAYQQIASD